MELESNSLIAIGDIEKGLNSFSRLGSLVENILHYGCLLDCSFSHVGRKINGCAHNLARYASEYSDYDFGHVPCLIFTVIRILPIDR